MDNYEENSKIRQYIRIFKEYPHLITRKVGKRNIAFWENIFFSSKYILFYE